MIKRIFLDDGKIIAVLADSITEEEIDASYEEFIEYVSNRKKSLILDVELLENIDGAGIDWLIRLEQCVRHNDGCVVIVGLRGLVKDRFEFIRLDQLFVIQ